MNIVNAIHLTKKYDDPLAVNNISFQIGKGPKKMCPFLLLYMG